ncbi:MAG TPA: penicillin-insensitive murein endopeptidase [Gemmatimonadales bacterium]|nr:penicillin-insensitive murein endopeptidase [Gemmatimonadales bacterium]
MLLVVLLAGATTGCGPIIDVFRDLYCVVTLSPCGDDSGESHPPADCISYLNGQSVGTKTCGPPWDSDNDTISTATETNPTNRVGNTPIAGFYTFDTLRWDLNYSQARGTATDGTLYSGINLRDSRVGYTHYDACDGTDVDDWGTGHLVRLIEATGRAWVTQPFIVDMQVGDMSRKFGGEFPGQPGVPGCETGHAYHQQGVDVDVRYVRKDGFAGPLDICQDPANYDTVATSWLIQSFLDAEIQSNANARIDSIFVDMPCWGLPDTTTDGEQFIFHSDGHKNHFHVRIRDPDGPSN